MNSTVKIRLEAHTVEDIQGMLDALTGVPQGDPTIDNYALLMLYENVSNVKRNNIITAGVDAVNSDVTNIAPRIELNAPASKPASFRVN